jgi:hypothetical protein
MQIDHLNGNILDYRARNLEMVTPRENIRRSMRLRALRKMGMNTNLLIPECARDFFRMSEADFLHFTTTYKVVNPGASSRRNGRSGLRREGQNDEEFYEPNKYYDPFIEREA